MTRKDKIPMYLNRIVICLTLLASMTMLYWCPIAGAQVPDNGDVKVSGVWKGTRTTTGGTGSDEFRVHSIRFDLKQSGEELSGSYKCYAGKKANVDCNNPLGKITGGTIKEGKLKLQVQALPNNLACSFVGSAQGNSMKGNFTCYVAGTLASKGVWEVRRPNGE